MADIEELMDFIKREYSRNRRVWNYEDHALVKFARENWEGLIKCKKDSILYLFYKEHNSKIKGRKGRLQKFPFFVFWLSEIIKEKSIRYYKLNKDEPPIKVSIWDRIDYVLSELYDENPGSIFNFPSRDNGWNFSYSNKIISRYRKREIVENDWIHVEANINLEKKINNNSEIKKFLKLDLESANNIKLSLEKLKKDAKLTKKIVDYLKIKKEATKRDLSRKFSKKYSDLYPALFELIYGGIINYNDKERKFVFITTNPPPVESQNFSHRVIPAQKKL